jgi:hypothetical protein
MITRHFDEVSGILTHKVTGSVTFQELVEYTLEYLAGDPAPLALWDASKASRLDLTMQDLRTFLLSIKTDTASRRNGRAALLFSDLSGFGLGRMLEVLGEVVDFPIEIRSFQDLEDAKKWLLAGEDPEEAEDDGAGVA